MGGGRRLKPVPLVLTHPTVKNHSTPNVTDDWRNAGFNDYDASGWMANGYFAVLTMDPAMSHGQWLLVTLTAGVGGSLLSIGSAAGVALMGVARGTYTFNAHLKWTPAIALGYVASIYAHMIINQALF